MKSKHGFGNIVMTAAGVLLCMTLISSYLSAGMYARYVSSDTAVDSARVAAFRITETGALSTSFAATLIPGVPCEVPVQVKNDSEVAVAYSIAIKNETKNLPLTFTFKKEGETTSTTTNDGSFVNTDNLAPGSGMGYTLEIYWAPTEIPDENREYIGYVDLINVTLTAEQVD